MAGNTQAPKPGVALIRFDDGAAANAVQQCQKMIAALTDVMNAYMKQVSQTVVGWDGYYRGIFDTEAQAVGVAGTALIEGITQLAVVINANMENVDAANRYAQTASVIQAGS